MFKAFLFKFLITKCNTFLNVSTWILFLTLPTLGSTCPDVSGNYQWNTRCGDTTLNTRLYFPFVISKQPPLNLGEKLQITQFECETLIIKRETGHISYPILEFGPKEIVLDSEGKFGNPLKGFKYNEKTKISSEDSNLIFQVELVEDGHYLGVHRRNKISFSCLLNRTDSLSIPLPSSAIEKEKN